MKKQINLTSEEKINFLAHLQLTDTEKTIKSRHKDLIITPITSLIVCALAGIIFPLVGFPPIVFGIISTGTILPITLLFECMILSYLMPDYKQFKKYSNGKISYKQYKILLKNGEIQNWQASYKTQIDQKVQEIKGIAYDAYKAEAENEFIAKAYESLPTKTTLDSEKITKKIKDMIDKNNQDIER